MRSRVLLTLASLTALSCGLVSCGGAAPQPQTATAARPPSEPAAPSEEFDSAPYVEPALDLLEAQLHTRPDSLGAVGLATGAERILVLVHSHDRFDAWRGEHEDAGAWEAIEASAMAEADECREQNDASIAEADAAYQEALEIYREDPEDQAAEEDMYEAESTLASYQNSGPDCDPWLGRGEHGFAGHASVFRLSASSESPLEELDTFEVDQADLPIEQVTVVTADLDDDGAPEIAVRFTALSYYEEMRGGEIGDADFEHKLLVLDRDGAVMLEATLGGDSGREPFTLHQAYFADVDQDGDADLVQLHWTLTDTCDCGDDGLPAERRAELDRAPSSVSDERFQYRAWNCAEGSAGYGGEAPGEACAVSEERSVLVYDASDRQWRAR